LPFQVWPGEVGRHSAVRQRAAEPECQAQQLVSRRSRLGRCAFCPLCPGPSGLDTRLAAHLWLSGAWRAGVKHVSLQCQSHYASSAAYQRMSALGAVRLPHSPRCALGLARFGGHADCSPVTLQSMVCWGGMVGLHIPRHSARARPWQQCPRAVVFLACSPDLCAVS